MDRKNVLVLIYACRAAERQYLSGIGSYVRQHKKWRIYPGQPYYNQGDFDPWFHKNRIRETIMKWKIDGIIANIMDDDMINQLPREVPCVISPRSTCVSWCVNTIGDSDQIGKLAAGHFLTKGYRYFAYCGFGEYRWSVDRRDGFLKYIRKAGFKVNVYQGSVQTQDQWWDYDFGPLREWIESLPKPVAVFACNDDRGRQILEVARETAVAVPQEMAVLGVDNDELVCEMTDPPLSSIAVNFEKKGYEVAAVLDRMMRGKKPKTNMIYALPVGVMARQSTDMLAVQNTIVSKAVDYIHQHLQDKLIVSTVAENMLVSRRTLERHFKQELGTSIHDYIRYVRLDEIKKMLILTDLPIKQIAAQFGYSDAPLFRSFFKRMMDVSPIVWRKQNRHIHPKTGIFSRNPFLG